MDKLPWVRLPPPHPATSTRAHPRPRLAAAPLRRRRLAHGRTVGRLWPVHLSPALPSAAATRPATRPSPCRPQTRSHPTLPLCAGEVSRGGGPARVCRRRRWWRRRGSPGASIRPRRQGGFEVSPSAGAWSPPRESDVRQETRAHVARGEAGSPLACGCGGTDFQQDPLARGQAWEAASRRGQARGERDGERGAGPVNAAFCR